MARLLTWLMVVGLVSCAEASWYWPFGDEKRPPRLSELMEPVSVLIGEASDLAADGKVTDAVVKYRAALVELARIEGEHPERAKTAEFSTVKTKRAYIEATIDALLMNQARANASPVAVSDTSQLAARLAAERREGAKAALAARDFARAETLLTALLKDNPKDVVALNLRAAKEAEEGRYAEAAKTLEAAMAAAPKESSAYYNRASLQLLIDPNDKALAQRFYRAGRAVGGPCDAELEAALK